MNKESNLNCKEQSQSSTTDIFSQLFESPVTQGKSMVDEIWDALLQQKKEKREYYKNLKLKDIDVNYDFRIDTPTDKDPDSDCPMMKAYHRLIYSKPLPDGREFKLKSHSSSYYYLTWNDMRFGSDSIIASFRYKDYQWMHDKLKIRLPEYWKFMHDYLHKAYTVGGEIIFPKHKQSINQNRGCNIKIRDRFDLTLECIRLFYEGKPSPLSKTIEADKDFFDLFGSFENYVKFFYLDDLCTPDYKNVFFWMDFDGFKPNPFPRTEDEYLDFIDKELSFVKKRNERIHKFCQEQS